MSILGDPQQMGNLQPGTQLSLLCPDGITQITYTIPSTCPAFSDLPDDCDHTLLSVNP